MEVRALRGRVLVTDIEKGMRMMNGFWIPNDDGTSAAIRPHWAKVYSVGDDITDIKKDDWILLKHGRWTRSIVVTDEEKNELIIWAVEWPEGVMCVAEEKPENMKIFSKWV